MQFLYEYVFGKLKKEQLFLEKVTFGVLRPNVGTEWACIYLEIVQN